MALPPRRERRLSMRRDCTGSEGQSQGRDQKMSNKDNGGRMTRRDVLVMIGNAILGSFSLPSIVSGVLRSVRDRPSESSTEEIEATIRRLVSKPIKTTLSDGRFFLFWTELTESEGGKVMIWTPETEDELAEAQRFYEAARGFNAVPQSLAPVAERTAEEQALTQAILNDVDAANPRLAYAEWLSRQGNSQGELIHICHKLKELDESDPMREPLKEYQFDLMDRDAERWLAPLAALGLRPVFVGHYLPSFWLEATGLVEELEIDKPRILPDLAEHLFNAAPVLHKLSFSYSASMARIATLPQMARLTSLKLPSQATLEDIEAVAFSRFLSRVRALDISYNEAGPEAVRILSGSPLLANLRTLNLARSDVGNDGVEILAGSAKAAQLSSLNLANNGIDLVAVKVFVASPFLKNLERIDLRANRFRFEDLVELRFASFFPRLKWLEMED